MTMTTLIIVTVIGLFVGATIGVLAFGLGKAGHDKG
jgi:hypothetical protein